jgi:RNA 3'-terminal phosphate cyclase (ATP)
MIQIDGSRKSGSGTIVRDATAFCILRGEGLRVKNIRAKRPKPGLRAQHLKALEACTRICMGELKGASLGSKEFTFVPSKDIHGGEYRWDIGTAGSTTMLALTVIPLALFADRPSRYRITGGLFQDFAPSTFHFQHVLLPVLQRMGVNVDVKIMRPGYVPQGQGVIQVTVMPAGRMLQPLSLIHQGSVTRTQGVALSSWLKGRKVSERMAQECRTVLTPGGYDPKIDILYDDKEKPVYDSPSVQPGAALALWAETDTHCLIGADMAGARGRSAEFMGKKTAEHLLEDLYTGASVDRHLADQIIPFAALAQGKSAFRIPRMTAHIETRLWLVEEILGAKTEVQGGLMRIQGIGYERGKGVILSQSQR